MVCGLAAKAAGARSEVQSCSQTAFPGQASEFAQNGSLDPVAARLYLRLQSRRRHGSRNLFFEHSKRAEAESDKGSCPLREPDSGAVSALSSFKKGLPPFSPFACRLRLQSGKLQGSRSPEGQRPRSVVGTRLWSSSCSKLVQKRAPLSPFACRLRLENGSWKRAEARSDRGG